MSLFDGVEEIINDDSFLIGNITEDIIKDMINPLIQKQKDDPTEPMPRIGWEVNKSYKMPFIIRSSEIVEKSINIRECLNNVLSGIGEDKLEDKRTCINCREVIHMGRAVDFVITALISKSPIILIENINELPESPRRKDIEGVLIHSWAKNEFKCLDYVYDTRKKIVIFTSRPKDEIGSGYYPVWDAHDNYQWYGNILKEILPDKRVVDEEKFRNWFHRRNK